MRIHVHHLYSMPNYRGGTGFCAQGSREWFASHGLSWSDFVAHGAEEAVLAATGDALALAVIEHAHTHADTDNSPEEADHGG